MGKKNGQGNEEEVTSVGSLDSALATLLKAADATDLSKSLGNVAVDQGGHTEGTTQTSGGYPEQSDVGELDSMMIGKMQNTLVAAGFDAGAIAAFMAGKAAPPFGGGDESDDDNDDDDDNDGEQMQGKFGKPADASGSVTTNGRPKPAGGKGGKGKGGAMGKSLDAMRSHTNGQGQQTIADAMDVSPFLADFAVAVSEQLDDMRKSLEEGTARDANITKSMAKAMFGIGQLVKGLSVHAERLDRRLGLVERTPQAPRGQQQLTGARPLHKSMPREAGAGGGSIPQAAEGLTKSEVLSTLSYMNLEKSIKEIGGTPTFEIAAIYEGGGNLPQAAFRSVVGFLSSHPHEAATARSYR